MCVNQDSFLCDNYIKMKIAICFSGAIRGFDECYPSIYKYLIKPLNPDIFLHTWNIPKVDKRLDVSFKMQKDSCTHEYVIEKLKPLRHIVEPYNKKTEERIHNLAGFGDTEITVFPKGYKKRHEEYIKYVYNSLGMYYSIFTANELKRKHEIENGFKYDLVIRARLDFIWQDYVLPEMFPKLGDRLMYIIRDDYVYLSGLTTNDKFLGASSRNMDEFCLIFKAMRKMYNKGRSIQATDIATFYFKHHYTPVLIGDKSHYAKHHFYFNKVLHN